MCYTLVTPVATAKKQDTNECRTTDQYDFIDFVLRDISILENLLDRFHCLAKEVRVEFLELGASQTLGGVVSVFERFNFEANGLLARERSPGLFDFVLELVHCM